MLFINISATPSIMFTSERRLLLIRYYEHLGRSILTEKPLKHNEKDATAVRKDCHLQNHPDLEMPQIITISN